MKTFLCPESQTLVHRQPCFTNTGYLRNFMIFVIFVPCSTNDRFLSVNRISLLKNSSKIAWHVWFWLVRCLPSHCGSLITCSTSYYTHKFHCRSFSLQSLLLCVFVSIKNVSVTSFSKNPLNTDTRIKRSTMICPLSVCINRFPLYI